MFSSLKHFAERKPLLDLGVGSLLTFCVFVLYFQSLVPSMLDGDPGHFQTVLPALGIPYPTGFPLYILLGHLWSYLPIGNVAYRINLFSAFFGALTIGALFLALRRQRLHWVASVGGAFTLALIPPFWHYATFASEYTLHTFMVAGLFLFLAEWETTRRNLWLWLAMFVFGCGLSNHPTFLLIAPATIIYLVLVDRRALIKQPRAYFWSGLLVALPITLYLYFPLRASQILTSSPIVLPDWTIAEAQGMVVPFYNSTPAGLFQYLTATAFIRGFADPWKLDLFLREWGTTIIQAVNLPILLVAMGGAINMARHRAKLAVWLTGVLLTFGLIAAQYANVALTSTITDLTPYLGKFFLPGFMALVIFSAWGMDALLRGLQYIFGYGRKRLAVVTLGSLFLMIFGLGGVWQDLSARHSTEWIKRSAEITARWKSIQQFAPEKDAALVGHWGDLTPLWYLQNVEGWRRDLITIYPPTITRVEQWLARGQPVYLAGSLLDWAPEIQKRYHLTPWGNLIRVTSDAYLPELPLDHSANWVLIDERPIFRLQSYSDVSSQVHLGESIDVVVYWELANTISLEDYLVYLSISSPDNDQTKQDYPLAVTWLPGNRLIASQRALSIYRYKIPAQVLPGEYPLRIFVYSIKNSRDLLITGAETASTYVKIGTVVIMP